jgi:dsDNA-specific endonuclease/ATPase MutS2
MPDSEPVPEAENDGAVRVPIGDSLDLHVFAPKDVPAVLADYLEECARLGFREVRLIHGRGTGTQRAIVRRFLATHPFVADFADAPPDRGGWGATVAYLRAVGPAP